MKITDFYNIAEDELSTRLLQWQKSVFDAARAFKPGSHDSLRYSSHVPLEMLPYDRQVEYMRQYRDIIGMNHVLTGMGGGAGTLAERRERIWGGLRGIVTGGQGSQRYGRFSVEDSGNKTLDAIYRSINVQFSDKHRDVLAGTKVRSEASRFGVGLRSVPVFHSGYGNTARGIAPGKSFMTFDIETAGLTKGQIREVSYGLGSVGAGGEVINSRLGSSFFNPKSFGRGVMGVTDSGGSITPVKLGDFMRLRHGINEVSDTSNFAREMTPFLEHIKSVDHVIGHNISRFDIEQVFHQLTTTPQYKDPTFRQLVDQAYDSIKPGSGKVIDTLDLARNAKNLESIVVDPKLAARGVATPYSIENLLLQTDLSEKIGMQKTLKMLSGQGLHAGAIDLEVTNALLQHLDTLKPQELGGSAVANGIRRIIEGSAAITPYTHIRSQDAITDPVLRRLIATGEGIEGGSKNLRKMLSKAASGDQKAAQDAYEFIRAGRAGVKPRFTINPIEQEVLHSRNLGRAADITKRFDPDSLVFRNNIFGRATGVSRALSENDGLRAFRESGLLNMEQMAGVQSQLADRNIPFAGLSFEERRIGTSLASITSDIPNASSAKIMGAISNDAMVSHFSMFDPNAVQYFTNSGRSSLPANLLSEAGILTSGGGERAGSLLSLSSINATERNPYPGMNLVYNFQSQEEVDNFSKMLTELAANPDNTTIARALGFNPSGEVFDSETLGAVSRFKAAVRDGLADTIKTDGLTDGVAIGQLHPDAARDATSLLSEVNDLSELSDRSMMGFKLPFMAMSPESGTIQTAGAVLDRGLTAEERLVISKEVAHTGNFYEAFGRIAKDTSKSVMARTSARFGGTDSAVKTMEQAYNFYQDAVRPNMGKGIIGVVGLALAGHFVKKHREVSQYDATMRKQPIENYGRYGVADQLQQRIDSGYNGYYQKVDPLATSFVVSNMDNSKINHSNMSPFKNNELYGGVL